MEKGPEEVVVE
jgi:hypothetical protein